MFGSSSLQLYQVGPSQNLPESFFRELSIFRKLGQAEAAISGRAPGSAIQLRIDPVQQLVV